MHTWAQTPSSGRPGASPAAAGSRASLGRADGASTPTRSSKPRSFKRPGNPSFSAPCDVAAISQRPSAISDLLATGDRRLATEPRLRSPPIHPSRPKLRIHQPLDRLDQRCNHHPHVLEINMRKIVARLVIIGVQPEAGRGLGY